MAKLKYLSIYLKYLSIYLSIYLKYLFKSKGVSKRCYFSQCIVFHSTLLFFNRFVVDYGHSKF